MDNQKKKLNTMKNQHTPSGTNDTSKNAKLGMPGIITAVAVESLTSKLQVGMIGNQNMANMAYLVSAA